MTPPVLPWTGHRHASVSAVNGDGAAGGIAVWGDAMTPEELDRIEKEIEQVDKWTSWWAKPNEGVERDRALVAALRAAWAEQARLRAEVRTVRSWIHEYCGTNAQEFDKDFPPQLFMREPLTHESR
jgi:hypothetical protein